MIKYLHYENLALNNIVFIESTDCTDHFRIVDLIRLHFSTETQNGSNLNFHNFHNMPSVLTFAVYKLRYFHNSIKGIFR